MSSARDQILGAVRASLGRGPVDSATASGLEARLTGGARHLQPKRVDRDHAGLVELFVEMAQGVAVTVDRLKSVAEAPAAIAAFLAQRNLPSSVVASPALSDLPWSDRPTLAVRFDRANGDDLVSVTPAFAAVAETGTLMLPSGSETPSTLNFLPDTHVVVLKSRDVVGPYEEAWDRLRAGGKTLPRTVNFVTGPSRTGDIEQTIYLGAHGPRHLHILLIDEA
jgi:L-lactate dehydrogenase complex protein LldG